MHNHRLYPLVRAFLLTLAPSVSLLEAERSGATVNPKKADDGCVPMTLSERAVNAE
jgi:hypothetical protein